METWNIHTSKGRYVGQSEARTPIIAFVQCAELTGSLVMPPEVRIREQTDDFCRIDHRGEEFVLTRTKTAVFGLP